MTKMRSPWLDQDARALVRRGATLEVAPAAAKARIRARVEAIIGSAARDAGARDTPHLPSKPLLQGVTRGLAIAMAFALGGGLGALAMYRLGHAQRAETTTESSVDLAATKVVEALPALPPAPVPTPATAVARERPTFVPSPSPKAPSSPAPDGLTDERTLLDEARVAVEREDGAAALAATEEHARRYPRGVLVQEREAIAVRALVVLGRIDEARARVERFRERFPDSLLLPALESTTGTAHAP